MSLKMTRTSDPIMKSRASVMASHMILSMSILGPYPDIHLSGMYIIDDIRGLQNAIIVSKLHPKDYYHYDY